MHGSLKTFALTKERLLTWILLSPSEGKDLKIGEKHFVFKQCRRGVSWQSKLIKSDCFSFETSLKPRTIFSVTCDVFPRQWIRQRRGMLTWHLILHSLTNSLSTQSRSFSCCCLQKKKFLQLLNVFLLDLILKGTTQIHKFKLEVIISWTKTPTILFENSAKYNFNHWAL